MPQPRRPRTVPPPAEAPDMTVPSLGGEADPIGSLVITETQEMRDTRTRPVGAEPDDAIRALMETDFRLQAELEETRALAAQWVAGIQNDVNETKTRIAGIDANVVENHRWLTALGARLDMLEEPQDRGFLYNFKIAPELAWGLGTVIATVLLQALVDVDKVSDWRAWAVGLGAALVRAILGFILAQGKVSSGIKPPNHHPTA